MNCTESALIRQLKEAEARAQQEKAWDTASFLSSLIAYNFDPDLEVGDRMKYPSGETGVVCWLDDNWVLAYQDTKCKTPRMYERKLCERA